MHSPWPYDIDRARYPNQLLVYTPVVPATNYYTSSNSMASLNETNGNVGLSAAGVTMDVESVDVQVGSYALKYTNTDGASDRVNETLTLDNATNYTMTFYAKQESGANFDTATWSGITNQVVTGTVTETYSLITITFDTTSTSVTTAFRNSGTGGTAVWIDDVKLFKTSEL